jgi:hypothetical protein
VPRLAVAAKHNWHDAVLGRAAHQLDDFFVVWRLAAHRVGLGGIASDQKSLAAAAAEILVALVAVAAGRFHPLLAPVGVKTLAARPDVGQRLVLHAR